MPWETPKPRNAGPSCPTCKLLYSECNCAKRGNGRCFWYGCEAPGVAVRAAVGVAHRELFCATHAVAPNPEIEATRRLAARKVAGWEPTRKAKVTPAQLKAIRIRKAMEKQSVMSHGFTPDDLMELVRRG